MALRKDGYRTKAWITELQGQALKLPPSCELSLPTFRNNPSNRKSWSSNNSATLAPALEGKSVRMAIVTSIQTLQTEARWQSWLYQVPACDKIAGIGKKRCRFRRLRVLEQEERQLFEEGDSPSSPRSQFQTSRGAELNSTTITSNSGVSQPAVNVGPNAVDIWE